MPIGGHSIWLVVAWYTVGNIIAAAKNNYCRTAGWFLWFTCIYSNCYFYIGAAAERT